MPEIDPTPKRPINKLRRAAGVAAGVVAGVVAVLFLLAWTLLPAPWTKGSSNRVATSTVANATPPESQETAPPASCYTDRVDRLANKSNAATRTAYVANLIPVMRQSGFAVSSKGEDEQILQIFGSPDTRFQLDKMAEHFDNADIQAGLCLQGFEEIQFVLYRSKSDQIVMTSFRTDPVAARENLKLPPGVQ